MKDRISWESIYEGLLSDGFWFQEPSRPKTLKAIEEVTGRMPDDDLETFMAHTSVIFAPAEINGCILPDLHTQGKPTPSVFVYLPYILEKRAQRRINSTVAHEFAHVVLIHRSMGIPLEDLYQQERQADMKIESWGFKPAYRDGDYPCVTS